MTSQLTAKLQRGDDEKLFASPKKPSRDFNKTLLELKSYLRFLILDKDINTGREIIDIKRAIDGYLSPTKKEVLQPGQRYVKLFMTDVEMPGHEEPSGPALRQDPFAPDDDTWEFNNQYRKPENYSY